MCGHKRASWANLQNSSLFLYMKCVGSNMNNHWTFDGVSTLLCKFSILCCWSWFLSLTYFIGSSWGVRVHFYPIRFSNRVSSFYLKDLLFSVFLYDLVIKTVEKSVSLNLFYHILKFGDIWITCSRFLNFLWFSYLRWNFH